jgi:hypothetical protein
VVLDAGDQPAGIVDLGLAEALSALGRASLAVIDDAMARGW